MSSFNIRLYILCSRIGLTQTNLKRLCFAFAKVVGPILGFILYGPIPDHDRNLVDYWNSIHLIALVLSYAIPLEGIIIVGFANPSILHFLATNLEITLGVELSLAWLLRFFYFVALSIPKDSRKRKPRKRK